MTVNALFVHGAGPNSWFGGYLEDLRNKTIAEFGNRVYVPRAIDYTEYNTLVRLLQKWKDPTILVALSCGTLSCSKAVAELSMEPIPYYMACSPSFMCGNIPIPPNVKRATQVTSNPFDMFNPGSRMLLKPSAVNKTSVVDSIYTGYRHTNSPGHPTVHKRLMDEIRIALAA